MFTCAFNRNVEKYQVPLALHEVGLLDKLVTDLYVPDLGPINSWKGFKSISYRHLRGLPFSKALSIYRAWMMQIPLRWKWNDRDYRTSLFQRLDSFLSKQALAYATKSGSDLFLHSGYAKEAFESDWAKDKLKGLSVYHPFGGYCQSILEEDSKQHPEIADANKFHQLEVSKLDSERIIHELRLADFVICASTFTKKSIENEVRPGVPIKVIPYGSDTASENKEPPNKAEKLTFLFVGQGIQRKGLHHLFKVWEELNWEEDAQLTIVCGHIDDCLQEMADKVGVEVLKFLPKKELKKKFSESHVFVMPSMVEGFGFVYIEALEAGCYVIGTENTGLVDLNIPSYAGAYIPAGDLAALKASMIEAREKVTSGHMDYHAISKLSQGYEWQKYRSAVADFALNLKQEFYKSS
tara:strand:- start:8317 stop:9543 length:1227 start_codon:yes stop_codon:yes gene_type:complete